MYAHLKITLLKEKKCFEQIKNIQVGFSRWLPKYLYFETLFKVSLDVHKIKMICHTATDGEILAFKGNKQNLSGVYLTRHWIAGDYWQGLKNMFLWN